MIGEIYLITNKLNGKKYVGKTVQGVKYRFLEHLKRAYTIDYSTYDYKYNNKFYRALRKYGRDNFIVESIGVFDSNILSEKEIEYIKKYDSYYSGYNSTLGGDGNSSIDLSNSEIDYIIREYNIGKSSDNISKEIGVGSQTILRILRSRNIDIRKAPNQPLKVVMYDKQFNPIHIFNSKKEIVNWLADNTDYAINLHSIYGLITSACQKGNTAYGFRWQLFLDLQCENKVFRTKFDKEAYLQGEKAYIPEGKDYWVVDEALSGIKIPKEKTVIKEKRCRNCDKIIDFGTHCNECSITLQLDKVINKNIKSMGYSDKRVRISEKNNNCIICGKEIVGRSLNMLCNSCANVASKGKNPKPSKEELKALLDNKVQTKQIAEMYGRSPSTVSTWIKKYGLR